MLFPEATLIKTNISTGIGVPSPTGIFLLISAVVFFCVVCKIKSSTSLFWIFSDLVFLNNRYTEYLGEIVVTVVTVVVVIKVAGTGCLFVVTGIFVLGIKAVTKLVVPGGARVGPKDFSLVVKMTKGVFMI